MGIDVYALTFLKFSANKKDFEKTITIGRQSLLIDDKEFEAIFRKKVNYIDHSYCEEMFKKNLHSMQVDSLDNSDYENATYIHDMNTEIPSEICGQYDTVIDAGSLEHVFNISQALKNCSQLLKSGGQIIHILPANNFCGHGFWQFSPELFFSLYSQANGYIDLDVYMVDLTEPNNWYQINKPKDGQRLNISSSNQLCIFARAILRESTFTHNQIQQSDYIYLWDKNNSSVDNRLISQKLKKNIRKIVLRNSILYYIFLKIQGFRTRINNTLSEKNKNIKLVKASDLIR